MLAHHYVAALELTGPPGEREERRSSRRRRSATSRSPASGRSPRRRAAPSAASARRSSSPPTGRPERPLLLERWAQAAQQQGRLREARDGARSRRSRSTAQRGDSVAAGRALTALSHRPRGGSATRARSEPLAEALALLEAQPPGPELVAAYAMLAGRACRLRASSRRRSRPPSRALALAAELGLPEPARALGFRGIARASLGEREGLEDMRRALALAIEQGEGRDAAVLYNNLAQARGLYEGPAAALALAREGIEFCERRGIAEFGRSIAALSLTFLAALGRPSRRSPKAEPLAAQLEAAGAYQSVGVRSVAAAPARRARAMRTDAAAAPSACRGGARDRRSRSSSATGLAAAARLLLAHGQARRRRARCSCELEQIAGTRGDLYYAANLPELVRSALALRDAALAAQPRGRRRAAHAPPSTPSAPPRPARRSRRATTPEAASSTPRRPGAGRQFGNVPERAYALLGHGRCLLALGRSAAKEPLATARELFASMGYKPALAETEALLAQDEAAAV